MNANEKKILCNKLALVAGIDLSDIKQKELATSIVMEVLPSLCTALVGDIEEAAEAGSKTEVYSDYIMASLFPDDVIEAQEREESNTINDNVGDAEEEVEIENKPKKSLLDSLASVSKQIHASRNFNNDVEDDEQEEQHSEVAAEGSLIRGKGKFIPLDDVLLAGDDEEESAAIVDDEDDENELEDSEIDDDDKDAKSIKELNELAGDVVEEEGKSVRRNVHARISQD